MLVQINNLKILSKSLSLPKYEQSYHTSYKEDILYSKTFQYFKYFVNPKIKFLQYVLSFVVKADVLR